MSNWSHFGAIKNGIFQSYILKEDQDKLALLSKRLASKLLKTLKTPLKTHNKNKHQLWPIKIVPSTKQKDKSLKTMTKDRTSILYNNITLTNMAYFSTKNITKNNTQSVKNVTLLTSARPQNKSNTIRPTQAKPCSKPQKNPKYPKLSPQTNQSQVNST